MKMVTLQVISYLISVLYYLNPCEAAELTMQNGTLDINATDQHILQLEKDFSDLKSQFEAQEQKQAAALSSLLSKLAATTDEFTNLKSEFDNMEANYSSSLLELSSVKVELITVTSEMKALRSNYESVSVELATTNADLNAPSLDVHHANEDIVDLQGKCNETTSQNTTSGTIEEIIKETTDLNSAMLEVKHNITGIQESLNSVIANLSLVYKSSPPVNVTCNSEEWRCDSGQCIPIVNYCDRQSNCPDGSDEARCEFSCTSRYFKCYNATGDEKRCIWNMWVCDGHRDCAKGEDEANCTKETAVTCGPNHFTCYNATGSEQKCIWSAYVCDGDSDCPHSEDEANCTTAVTCGPSHFTCYNSIGNEKKCTSSVYVCDGDSDCPHSEDEANCSKLDAPEHLIGEHRANGLVNGTWHVP